MDFTDAAGTPPADDLDDSGDEEAMKRHEYRVLAICGPGDQDEPVITLLRADEVGEQR